MVVELYKGEKENQPSPTTLLTFQEKNQNEKKWRCGILVIILKCGKTISFSIIYGFVSRFQGLGFNYFPRAQLSTTFVFLRGHINFLIFFWKINTQNFIHQLILTKSESDSLMIKKYQEKKGKISNSFNWFIIERKLTLSPMQNMLMQMLYLKKF